MKLGQIRVNGAVTAVLAVCLTVVSTRSSVSGASINPTGPVAAQGGILDVLARQRLAIVGAWNVPDPEGISSLYTFNADGTMSESDVDHTFTAGHGWLQFPVGGGIVADSDPVREYEETLHKAAGLLRALEP